MARAGHRMLGVIAALVIASPAAASPPQVIGRSVQGRPILAYRVGDPAAPMRVLVVGCIHGDECAAFPVIARLIRQRPPVGVQLWVVPSVNPDGRRAGTRGNAHGVDLNRNFPFHWRAIARPSRYYSGPRPLSEPESRAVAGLILAIRMDLSIWYQQPERNVRDPDGSPQARRYARLAGLPFLRLAAPPGTVAEWTEFRIPGAEAFVVGLPAGPLAPAAVARHVGAVRASAQTPVPAAGQLSASVFVAPNGSDVGSNCVRFTGPRVFPADRTTVCASLGKAYALAAPGDTILVGNGSYGNQQICRGSTWPTCSSSGDRSGPVITVQAETRHGARVVGHLYLGLPTAAVPSPSNITIDGIDVNGKIVARQPNSWNSSTNITLQNMHVWDLSSNLGDDLGGGLISWGSGNVDGLTFNNDEIGPSCCNRDGLQFAISPPATTVPTNLTISNSTIHDLYDTCNAVPSAITDKWGTCTGTGYGDPAHTGNHTDGIHLWGGVTNLELLNNKWYGISRPGVGAGQTIFLECGDVTGSGGNFTCTNITIKNNMAFSGSGTDNNVVSMGNRYPGTPGIAGDVRILYNTIWDAYNGANSLAIGSPGGDGLAPTATVEIVGNIVRKIGNSCNVYRKDGTTMTPTYRNNLVEFATCGASDQRLRLRLRVLI